LLITEASRAVISEPQALMIAVERDVAEVVGLRMVGTPTSLMPPFTMTRSTFVGSVIAATWAVMVGTESGTSLEAAGDPTAPLITAPQCAKRSTNVSTPPIRAATAVRTRSEIFIAGGAGSSPSPQSTESPITTMRQVATGTTTELDD
jgi:hypothetical protein